MRVEVDRSQCQGHNRCYVLAREVFDVDDEGYAFVRPGCNLDDSNVQELVRNAARNCPERAIVVDDE